MIFEILAGTALLAATLYGIRAAKEIARYWIDQHYKTRRNEK